MKYLFLFFFLFSLSNSTVRSQVMKKDTTSLIKKEDSQNTYGSENISKLDLIQALEATGVRIHKFHFGDFDKKYNFHLMIDEYKNDVIVNTDTIINDDNLYVYFEEGKEGYFLDFISQMKIITKDIENKTILTIITYGRQARIVLRYTKIHEDQFFNWRKYSSTKWQLNKKIPLLVWASSWKDKKSDYHRFCGASKLSENNESTTELLSSSPHYFKVYYTITEFK